MNQDLSAGVSALLRQRGWTLVRAGTSGGVDLWSLPDTSTEMYLPRRMNRGSFEATDVIERIAIAHGEKVRQIERAVDMVQFDVTKFRVDNDPLGNQTIPLEAGTSVITSAFGMIRAAATTARRPRSSIGNNYSSLGDELARSARLGHTEVGSFVFPVLMQVSEPLTEPEETLRNVMFDSVRPESDERRVIRTLAQALSVFEKRILGPAVEPRAADLTPVVIAGGSREIFTHINRVLSEPNISWFETGFAWAPSETVADDTPVVVRIPSDARDLVAQTVKLLSRPDAEPLRIVTGPITYIAHTPGDPFGEIAIQSPRPSGAGIGRVEVRVRASELSQLHHWMDTATTVVVQGMVERRPGRPARLRELVSPQALSDTISGI